MPRLLVLLTTLALAGCLRVGPGEDLHLVCEEKSAAPRMAYGIDFLVAQTRTDEGVPFESKLALLDAARAHLITPRGAAHAGFEARLTTVNASTWSFEATGVWDEAPPDVYRVELRGIGETIVASAPPPNPGPVMAPRTIEDQARAIANQTSSFDARNATLTWVAWDPELPSCARLGFGAREVVVNLVQLRVVHVEIDDV